jgi:hypothetical protein
MNEYKKRSTNSTQHSKYKNTYYPNTHTYTTKPTHTHTHTHTYITNPHTHTHTIQNSYTHTNTLLNTHTHTHTRTLHTPTGICISQQITAVVIWCISQTTYCTKLTSCNMRSFFMSSTGTSVPATPTICAVIVCRTKRVHSDTVPSHL